MIISYPDHCKIVKDALEGNIAADEKTFASITALSERLEQVRKLGGGFAEVGFSPAVNTLRRTTNAVAIG